MLPFFLFLKKSYVVDFLSLNSNFFILICDKIGLSYQTDWPQ